MNNWALNFLSISLFISLTAIEQTISWVYVYACFDETFNEHSELIVSLQRHYIITCLYFVIYSIVFIHIVVVLSECYIYFSKYYLLQCLWRHHLMRMKREKKIGWPAKADKMFCTHSFVSLLICCMILERICDAVQCSVRNSNWCTQ